MMLACVSKTKDIFDRNVCVAEWLVLSVLYWLFGFLGLLPVTNHGIKYLLICAEYSTGCLVVKPTERVTASEVTALTQKEIIRLLGAP